MAHGQDPSCTVTGSDSQSWGLGGFQQQESLAAVTFPALSWRKMPDADSFPVLLLGKVVTAAAWKGNFKIFIPFLNVPIGPPLG